MLIFLTVTFAFVIITSISIADEPAFDIAARESTLSKLQANGDINAWDDEIAYAAKRDPDTEQLTFLFERGDNPPKVTRLSVPGFFFREEF